MKLKCRPLGPFPSTNTITVQIDYEFWFPARWLSARGVELRPRYTVSLSLELSFRARVEKQSIEVFVYSSMFGFRYEVDNLKSCV